MQYYISSGCLQQNSTVYPSFDSTSLSPFYTLVSIYSNWSELKRKIILNHFISFVYLKHSSSFPMQLEWNQDVFLMVKKFPSYSEAYPCIQLHLCFSLLSGFSLLGLFYFSCPLKLVSSIAITFDPCLKHFSQRTSHNCFSL